MYLPVTSNHLKNDKTWPELKRITNGSGSPAYIMDYKILKDAKATTVVFFKPGPKKALFLSNISRGAF